MLHLISTALIGLFIIGSSAFAAEKTYQVTGPILEVTDSTIVVDKKGEKWEVSKDAASVVHGDLKKGNKVTIKYKMVATDVEVKDDTPAKKKK
jgi:RNase P/RNase MRP subunit p29